MDNLKKHYRFHDNPDEKRFHDTFREEFETDVKKSQIVFPSLDGITPISFLNEREIQIVENTIQWLGSPVGQTFLRNCGFEKREKK